MSRLTAKRCNGIKDGYWSSAKKDELIQRLGEYEDLGLGPKALKELKTAAGVNVLYLCDKRACDGNCKNSFCQHTRNPEHAKNFYKMNGAYWENDELPREPAANETAAAFMEEEAQCK